MVGQCVFGLAYLIVVVHAHARLSAFHNVSQLSRTAVATSEPYATNQEQGESMRQREGLKSGGRIKRL